ncbi:DUF1476 domain-containing protein [Sulfitobacter sp. HNIBRBA3233]|uniref:DUF1476 domain-containing protein n=1 Tax=Sulfitobacter marinivivus TaxID=3158558 RepID=UPI0032DEE77F
MDNFKEREKAFEKKFAHDAEMQFRAEARRNRLVGQWAAGLLGMTEVEAQAYAQEVVKADFEEAGDGDVMRKLETDLGDRADRATIRAKMDELLAVARAQIMAEHS